MSFPNLIDHENSTLYVIGNGFDLYHGLPTSYHDFYKWLLDMRQYDFINKMEEIFYLKNNNQKLLWCDFETALGEYDLDDIFQKYTPDYTKRYISDVELFARNAIEPTINCIKEKMLEWVKDIKLRDYIQTPKLKLPQASLYLTFNYTLTLEEIYNLPTSQILHLHNSVIDNKVVVGNNIKIDRWKLENDKLPDEEEQSKKLSVDILNKLYKEPDIIIRRNANFFSRLKCIDHIVILGHSLSDIDLCYFRKICSRVQPNSHWFISMHGLPNKERTEHFLRVITSPLNNGTNQNNITFFSF